MIVSATWTAFGDALLGDHVLEKGPDDGNRNMYLVDSRGERYDHVASTEAARFGARLHPDRPRVGGTFIFPIPAGAPSSFRFRDDDQRVSVDGIVLDPARRTSPEASREKLSGILATDSIEIVDKWGGLGGSHSKRWQLKRGRDGFAGDARVPLEQVTRFLELLAEAPLLPGPYLPHWEHTDDYPHLEINLRRAGNTISFHSESQGSDHVPWACTSGGTTWVVPNDVPARALDVLRPLFEGKRPATAAPAGQGAAAAGEQTAQLRLAAERGDLERIRALLAEGADPNRRTDYDGETALCIAASSGQAGSVRALIAGGAHPAETNANGESALVLAASRGHHEVLQELTRAYRWSKSALGEAVQAATVTGSVASLEILLQAGGRGLPLGDALFWAAVADSTEMIGLLLRAGARVNLPVAPSGNQGPPLIGAIHHGHLEATRVLIEGGARLGACWDEGTTPLHVAAGVGHADVVELLLRSGAAVDAARVDGRTPLFYARVRLVVEVLLRAGADPNARLKDGTTPLIALAGRGSGQLRYGSASWREPPKPDPIGTARLLLEVGASVDVENALGRTPLLASASDLLVEHNVELASLLLGRGANPNARDREGRTPLWHATQHYVRFSQGPGSTRVAPLIRALLASGARNIPDNGGVSPLDLAIQSRNATLLRLLRSLPY